MKAPTRHSRNEPPWGNAPLRVISTHSEHVFTGAAPDLALLPGGTAQAHP
jgi:hypothetical protein